MLRPIFSVVSRFDHSLLTRGYVSPAIAVSIALAVAACASPTHPDDSGTGGASSGGSANGGASSGGAPKGGAASGGASSGGASSGGASSGGASSGGSSSGGSSSGGSSSGGASSGGTATGGAANGGSAGSTSKGGSAGGGGAGNGGSAGSAGKAGGGGTSSGGTAGGGGATACPGFVLCDDFQDGNHTANPTWLVTPSAFTVVTDGDSQVLKQTPMEAWGYTGMATWTDVTIQLRMKVLDFAGTSTNNCAGPIARWLGSSAPFYQLGLCAKGDIGVYKDGDVVDETNGFKASGVVANTWYNVKMKVAGAPGNVTITAWLNDAQVFSIKDTDTSTPVPSGFIALGSKKELGVEYDDVKVSTP